MPQARAVLVAAAAILLAMSLWSLNLTVFHWWASGAPPTTPADKEWHEHWGNVFAGVTVVTALGFALLARLARRGRRER